MLWPEQPAEADEELQEGREIAERQEEQEHERRAEQIHIEGWPLAGRLAAGGTDIIEPADCGVAMRTGRGPAEAHDDGGVCAATAC